jgi:hypothetical protein
MTTPATRQGHTNLLKKRSPGRTPAEKVGRGCWPRGSFVQRKTHSTATGNTRETARYQIISDLRRPEDGGKARLVGISAGAVSWLPSSGGVSGVAESCPQSAPLEALQVGANDLR